MKSQFIVISDEKRQFSKHQFSQKVHEMDRLQTAQENFAYEALNDQKCLAFKFEELVCANAKYFLLYFGTQTCSLKTSGKNLTEGCRITDFYVCFGS